MTQNTKPYNPSKGAQPTLQKGELKSPITGKSVPKIPRKSKRKTEIKTEKVEREYVIPLREKVRVVPRYKKTNKAVKTVKEFLARHMKVRDRDLNKIKIDKYLNEVLWFRGIRKPPHKIKVKAVKEGDIIRAELADMPDALKFKKAREEKKVDTLKDINEKEKKSAVVEAGAKMEKAASQKAKHATQAAGKATKQKHQVRKALAK